MLHRFGRYELDEAQRELRLDGRDLGLQPKLFDLLLYLVRNRERVVSKEELLDEVWPEAFVADGALQRAVSLLRTRLTPGDARDSIRTFARRGYRFCAPVNLAPEDAGSPADTSLDAACRACETGDWDAALAVFQAKDAEGALNAVHLERWAEAAHAAGRQSQVVGPLERAAVAYAADGDRRGAARASLMLARVQGDRREAAVARGWMGRAATHLEGLAE